MKPDCAWLKAALGQREANRQAETQSLTEAIQLIKVPSLGSTGIHWDPLGSTGTHWDPLGERIQSLGFKGKRWTSFWNSNSTHHACGLFRLFPCSVGFGPFMMGKRGGFSGRVLASISLPLQGTPAYQKAM